MNKCLVTVAVPTLAADEKLAECLRSLEGQAFREFEVVVVDNSGRGLVRPMAVGSHVRVLECERNTGFGAAVNAVVRGSGAPYIATLNDDAAPHPGWLAALVEAMERRPDVGMCASQVRLYGEEQLDSCGMLVAADGSSKQRGHLRRPADFPVEEEVLLPSASAALYRRRMLEETGLFDEEFFLYCEDTDLGLRARRLGWRCLYVPLAVVEHHYSHSAGRASPLKAYYVERNRLFLAIKNFPAAMLPGVPAAALGRYVWHLLLMLQGRGSAARFRAEGHAGIGMVVCVLKAHAAVAVRLPALLKRRRAIARGARVTTPVFRRLLRSHSIPVRKVAEL